MRQQRSTQEHFRRGNAAAILIVALHTISQGRYERRRLGVVELIGRSWIEHNLCLRLPEALQPRTRPCWQPAYVHRPRFRAGRHMNCLVPMRMPRRSSKQSAETSGGGHASSRVVPYDEHALLAGGDADHELGAIEQTIADVAVTCIR